MTSNIKYESFYKLDIDNILGEIIMKDYEKELQKHEQIKESNSAAENVIKFYSMNKSFCDKAYNYYKEYKNFKNLFSSLQFLDLSNPRLNMVF